MHSPACMCPSQGEDEAEFDTDSLWDEDGSAAKELLLADRAKGRLLTQADAIKRLNDCGMLTET